MPGGDAPFLTDSMPITHGPSLPVVRRQRLTARLHELIHRRLTLVVAPAGYGKTTLLADFAADCAAAGVPLAICWYTAAPWDADGTLVLEGIVTAVRGRFPAFGERTLRLLAEARAGTSPSESERLLVSAVGILVGELREHVPDYLVLVVDDYHLLDASASARGLLELLLDRLPAHMHVVLLSRTVPVLDTSRLLLADEVGGLGPPDLAFTPDELACFLRQRFRLEPDPGLVEELYQRTEGWIAGVVLAMPAPVDGPPSARTAALRSTLAESWSGGERLREYLAGQLFRRQSPEDQDLLLAAALPDVCDPAELNEVLERIDSNGALARLERAGLPLIWLNAGRSRYRLHALLQQFLRTHLIQASPERHRQLRQRWGHLAEARGDYAAAVAQYLAGRLYDRAARVLEQVGERWIDLGRRQLVESWLVQLPPPLMERRPRLGLCAARLCIAQGQRALAVERARQAGFSAQRKRDAVAAARALLLEAMAVVSIGRTEEGLHLCLQALAHRTVRRHKLLLAEAYRSLSMAEMIRGLLAPALEHMEQALALYEQGGQPWDVAVALNNLGLLHEQLGQAERASWYHTRALTLRRELGDLAGVGRSLNNLALLRFYQGSYGEAEAMFHEAVALAEQTGNLRSEAVAHLNLGDLRRAQQRPAEALGQYRAALDAAEACQDPQWCAYALAMLAAAYLAEGDTRAGQQAARQALERAERAGLLEVSGQARAVLAAAALACGRRREAAALLNTARQAARETGSKPLQVRVYLWSGLAAYQQRRWGEALACVEVAAAAAAALGGPALLALEGLALVPLLRMAADRGVAPQLIAGALDHLDAAAAAAVREAVAPRPAPAALPALKLRLLGTFGATLAGRSIEPQLPPRSRVRELLAYLAVHSGGRRREELALDLWPNAEPGHDVTLTHTTLHRLRLATFPELVLAQGAPGLPAEVYRINPTVSLDVDVHRFEQLLETAEQSGIALPLRRALLTRAVAAYGGLFLPDCYSDWAAVERRRLEQRYTTALAQLIDAEWTAGDYRACLEWCQRLLEVEDAEDAIHCRALDCYERLGEPLAGVLHYRRYARELAEQDQGQLSTRAGIIYRRLEAALVGGQGPVATGQ